MEVRPANVSDINTILELFLQEGLVTPGIDNLETYTRKLEHDPESILVAQEGHEIIGAVLFRYDPWVSIISSLAVFEPSRNIGVAEELVKEVVRITIGRGTSGIQAYIASDNEACLTFSDKFNKIGAKTIEHEKITEVYLIVG